MAKNVITDLVQFLIEKCNFSNKKQNLRKVYTDLNVFKKTEIALDKETIDKIRKKFKYSVYATPNEIGVK